MTGRMPTAASSVISPAKLARSAGSSIVDPPYLTTTTFARKAWMYGSASMRILAFPIELAMRSLAGVGAECPVLMSSS